MSLPSDDNKTKKYNEPDSIFPTLEIALHTLHIYSYGLESTKVPEFDLSARTGLSILIKQACITGFNYTDRDNSKDEKESENFVDVIDIGTKQKGN